MQRWHLQNCQLDLQKGFIGRTSVGRFCRSFTIPHFACSTTCACGCNKFSLDAELA
ncbi:hypothetical protein M758_7G124900 [Ceratodon purpureus]|uniref:Uncharacterized protein n=1 Tax=Ceratodon purpureus TaxID=3225 RepID=A0A8T0H8C7_CERPU|nr:hypothetical protein KC19_7G152300 [Ceratodon purpureus]KAG0611229.1 hypothetical protein M758_7G124900 [Ceratodon purpureus]